MAERNETIDIARGLGIIFVILGHLVCASGKVSIVIFSFHMPLFFFLSGIVMQEPFTREKVIYRIRNLIFPYAFFLLLGLVVTMIIPQWRKGLLSLEGLVYLLYDVIYNLQPESLHVGQIWFLIAMFWIMLFHYFSHSISFKSELIKNWNWIILGLGGVIITDLCSKLKIGIYFQGYCLSFPFKFMTAVAGFFFFEVGYYCKKKGVLNWIENCLTSLRQLLLFFVLIVTNVAVAIYNGKVNIAYCTYNNLFLYLVGSMSGIAAIILLAVFMKKMKLYFFAWYGKNSLTIFCFHSFWIYLYANLLSSVLGKKIVIMENINFFLSVVGSLFVLVLSIPVPWLYGSIRHAISGCLGKRK